MNNLFQENKRIFLLLVSLLLVLLIVLYFVLLQPLLSQLDSMKKSSEGLQSEIAFLQQQENKDKKTELFNPEVYKYDKKLPKTKQLDQLLLKFEEIEAVSSGQIIKIDFTYDGSFPKTGFNDNEGKEKTNEESETGNNVENTEETSKPVDNTEKESVEPVIDISNKPEALQPIVINLEVAAPDYKHFKKFLTEIEKEERLTVVSTLEFDKPAEQELIFEEKPKETMVFTLQLMTFYYEE